MSRNYNHRLVKRKHVYDFKEIARLFNVHVCTVRRWHKKGLKVLDENQRPYLVLGKELISFIKKQKAKRRISLSVGEFMCTKCGKARRSKNDLIKISFRESKFSTTNRKADIVGVCEQCKRKLNLFSSENKIKEMLNKEQIELAHGERLSCSTTNAVNARFKRKYYE